MHTRDTAFTRAHAGSGAMFLADQGTSLDSPPADPGLLVHIDAACAQACNAIAPAWPLDRAIAVNPHWGRINRPLRQVAVRMAVFADIQVFPPRDYLREAWDKGRITREDLEYARICLPGPEANSPSAAGHGERSEGR